MGSTRTALTDLHARAEGLHADQLALEDEMIDHRSALSAPDSLLHRLQALHAQLDLLTRTRDYFIELETAEALSKLARDLFARGQTADALGAYRDLVGHAEKQRGAGRAQAFVQRVAEQTWLAGRAVLSKCVGSRVEGR